MNLPRVFRYLLPLLVMVVCLSPLRAETAASPVVITESETTIALANGKVSLLVDKDNGSIISLQSDGVDMLSKSSRTSNGYFNVYGGIPGQKYTQEKGKATPGYVTIDPTKNGGDRGEINFHFPYTAKPGTVPLDIDIRFTLQRGDTAIYAWTVLEHAPHYPAFDMAVCTVCLKMNPETVDFLSIDSRRQKLMPTPAEWVGGTQLNLWEARVIKSGLYRGKSEHKYDYNMLFSETPAWGWSGTKSHVGLFIVNPSIEYLNGPPVMCDYGGHLDVRATLPADPTLLFIWHSPHYGGKIAQINADEAWKKVVGPFLFYCNSGSTPEAMYQDAMARAQKEKAAWPYEWAHAEGYAHAGERGSASGHLTVKDPHAPLATAANAWVGLAAEPYEVFDQAKKAHFTIDWQTDGKNYGYWARADEHGNFTIPNARPGTYHLYAFTDGVLGDFSQANVTIQPGKANALGELTWVPERFGRQLWDIGIPNRSAQEFRHGDHYWQWGLYGLYPNEFPHDVDFAIGKSDYRTDWNYAQPPRPADAESAAINLLPSLQEKPLTDGKDTDASPAKVETTMKKSKGRFNPTTWKIRYTPTAPLQGTVTLRIAICGFRGGPVEVGLNNNKIGTTGDIPESGVMHRDGIRSDAVYVRDIAFDAKLLQNGENVFTLTKAARDWPDGVLYDYLRLEVDEARKFVEPASTSH